MDQGQVYSNTPNDLVTIKVGEKNCLPQNSELLALSNSEWTFQKTEEEGQAEKIMFAQSEKNPPVT